jgi:tRNA 2-selenouridine synthase
MSLQFLEENNLKECFSILLKYYDKQYSKGLNNRPEPKPTVTTIPTVVVNDSINADLLLK